MDVAGWKVQAKHNSATVDSFGISGEVSGVGIRMTLLLMVTLHSVTLLTQLMVLT
jgi:hypothetical protein